MTETEAVLALQALVSERTRGMGWWVTDIITACVCDWAKTLGAVAVETEAAVVYTWRGRRIPGHVDVVASWASGVKLAVEIDRTNKPQSVMKLRALKAAGYRIMWLRWNEANHHAETLPQDITAHWLHIAQPQALPEYLAKDTRRRRARARKHA